MSASNDDYKYDVFISYSAIGKAKEWVSNFFTDLFLKTMKVNNPSFEHFIYDQSLITGELWDKKIKMALAYSKCLIPIWYPSYFSSDWCKKECAIMLYRARQLKQGTIEKPNVFILPITIHDGESFPEIAKNIEWEDFTDFFYTVPSFLNSEKGLKFEEKINNLSVTVAGIIQSAPPWNKEWTTDRFFNNAIRNCYELFNNPEMRFPRNPKL